MHSSARYPDPHRPALVSHKNSFVGLADFDPSLPGANGQTDAIESAVNSSAMAFMANQQTVGLSIGIYQRWEDVYIQLGTMERGNRICLLLTRAMPSHPFTKTFTGALLAQGCRREKGETRRRCAQVPERRLPESGISGAACSALSTHQSHIGTASRSS